LSRPPDKIKLFFKNPPATKAKPARRRLFSKSKKPPAKLAQKREKGNHQIKFRDVSRISRAEAF
jgi:hypothetical protein